MFPLIASKMQSNMVTVQLSSLINFLLRYVSMPLSEECSDRMKIEQGLASQTGSCLYCGINGMCITPNVDPHLINLIFQRNPGQIHHKPRLYRITL